MSAALPPMTDERFPRQVRYIIGNEAGERFSFYGMRNILTVFLIDYLLVNHHPDPLQRQALAKAHFHLFVSGVFFFPLIGGYLSDRYFGKYRTIFWLSLLYCAGHACLALFEGSVRGFYTGLVLIAVGSGGIKPCVSAMVGDQFTQANKHLVKKVFAAFYFSINFGSFFASLLMPKLLRLYGPGVAFGVPGALMFVATLIFWSGRRHYVIVPPTGPDPHAFLKVVGSALRHRRPGAHWLDSARAEHPADAVDGAKAVFRVLTTFLPIPFFWMLFDQKASTWIVQARSMDPQLGPWRLEPSQMQLVNPALVMLLIPLTTQVLYPLATRLGYELKPLRRMVLGMVLGASSFGVAGGLQVLIDGGQTLSVLWQAGPYLLLTAGEVLLSTTGLEFAYSQAPPRMKSTITSFWLLTTTAANVAVAIASAFNFFSGPALFFYYAAMALVAAGALAWIARGYQGTDYFLPAGRG